MDFDCRTPGDLDLGAMILDFALTGIGLRSILPFITRLIGIKKGLQGLRSLRGLQGCG